MLGQQQAPADQPLEVRQAERTFDASVGSDEVSRIGHRAVFNISPAFTPGGLSPGVNAGLTRAAASSRRRYRAGWPADPHAGRDVPVEDRLELRNLKAVVGLNVVALVQLQARVDADDDAVGGHQRSAGV